MLGPQEFEAFFLSKSCQLVSDDDDNNDGSSEHMRGAHYMPDMVLST